MFHEILNNDLHHMVSRASPSTVRSRLSGAALEEFNWSARGRPPSRSTRFEEKTKRSLESVVQKIETNQRFAVLEPPDEHIYNCKGYSL